MELDSEMHDTLRRCHREFIVNFPVEMDDGSRRMYTGIVFTIARRWGRPRAASGTTRT